MPLRKCCAHHGCRVLLPRGVRFCDYHRIKAVKRKTEKITEYGYKRSHWQEIRKERLIMSGGLCELQLPGCTFEATHVHLHEDLHGDHDRATIDDTKACCLNCSSSIDGGRAHGRTAT